MKVVGTAGDERRELVDRLVARLGDHGTVGRIAPEDDAERRHGSGAVVTYRVGSDGHWSATGHDLDAGAALDRLSPECDYAVVEGHPELDVPRIAVGDHDAADPLAEAETVEDLDVDAAVAAVDALDPHETLASLVARAKDSPESDRSGAIATFTGRVRARDDPGDPPTEYLEFEKYDGVAEERMASIGEELESREGVFEVVLHHRTGVVEAGEDIVFVVVLAGHRREAFRTVEDGIDRLKEEVPLFKREVTVEEEFWVHDRE
jgi:molybdopterin synthase catalytic subunit